MFIDETPQEEQLRAELRAYFSKLMTPEIYAATRDGVLARSRAQSKAAEED